MGAGVQKPSRPKQTVTLADDAVDALEKLKGSIGLPVTEMHKTKLDVPPTPDVRQWAQDILDDEQVKAELVEECDGDWYVASFDQDTSSRAAEVITTSMLFGKLPYGGRLRESVLDYTLTTDWDTFVASIEKNKSVWIKCVPTSITVYGLPRDVITTVSAIEDKLAAETKNHR